MTEILLSVSPSVFCWRMLGRGVDLATLNWMCVKKNTHVARTSRNRISTKWDLYCCLVPQCVALCTCCLAFLIITKCCFDQDVKVVSRTAFTKSTYNLCCSLQKRWETIETLALHWKCGFRMANTRNWPEMNMYLDLNHATFQYIDGFWCYHFCLNRFGLVLMIFFWTSQVSDQFWDCRLP